MDCDRILLAEKENVKALLRRATAYTNLGKEKMNNDTANFQKAHNDILTIEKIDNDAGRPNAKDVQILKNDIEKYLLTSIGAEVRDSVEEEKMLQEQAKRAKESASRSRENSIREKQSQSQSIELQKPKARTAKLVIEEQDDVLDSDDDSSWKPLNIML